MKNSLAFYNEDGEEIAAIYSFRREGDKLIADAKALGAMRMDMIITSEQFLPGLKVAFSWAVISFIFLMPYFVLRRMVTSREKGDF